MHIIFLRFNFRYWYSKKISAGSLKKKDVYFVLCILSHQISRGKEERTSARYQRYDALRYVRKSHQSRFSITCSFFPLPSQILCTKYSLLSADRNEFNDDVDRYALAVSRDPMIPVPEAAYQSSNDNVNGHAGHRQRSTELYEL